MLGLSSVVTRANVIAPLLLTSPLSWGHTWNQETQEVLLGFFSGNNNSFALISFQTVKVFDTLNKEILLRKESYL